MCGTGNNLNEIINNNKIIIIIASPSLASPQSSSSRPVLQTFKINKMSAFSCHEQKYKWEGEGAFRLKVHVSF